MSPPLPSCAPPERLDPTRAGLDPATLAARARALCAWHDRPRVASVADPKRLAEILARPRFAFAREPVTGGWTRFWEWLWAWLTDALTARPMQSFASGTRFLVLVLAGMVVLFGLYRWLRRRRAQAILPVQAPARGRDALELHEPSVHLESAGRLVESNPREALREALLALLSTLEEARWARPDRVKTNRELASELLGRGAPPPLADRVKGLLGWYDGVFYSLRPVPPPEARRFLDQVGQLNAEVRAP